MTKEPWQPIETAPKDIRILVSGPTSPNGDPHVDIARFNDDRYGKRPKPYWDRESAWFGTSGSRYYVPTHWMPLPAPFGEEP